MNHKFRAWDKVRDQWIYFTVGQINDHTLKEVYSRLCIENAKFHAYIGRNDKKSQEIYHESIVKTPQGIGYITWDKVFLGWAIKSPGSDAVDLFLAREVLSWEVIGNLTENPELISQE